MPLAPGVRLGAYEVLALIGAGGMGEVYRARDSKLNRDVALKVLSDSFANDPERLARFQREAQVLASLNHPNIGGIYGLEDADGVRALVLELVEGPTLADRITQGPIPLDEALPIAKQIAEALEAAHEHGVIHRDLKPANIKLRRDGMVKVLDFGLAKALDPAPTSDLSQSPTVTSPAMTRMGVTMGTVLVSVLILLSAASTSAQTAMPAVDVTAADIQAFINRLPKDAISDLPIRVADVGGYKVGVYGVFRPKASAQDAVLHETTVSEIYYILEGAGTLVTGGTLVSERRTSGSTTVRGSRIDGGVSRRVAKGDLVIIPGRAPHWWSNLEGDISYLIIRPDPEGEQTLK